MIHKLYTYDTIKTAVKTPFQNNILVHWEDIKQGKAFPSKPSFQPQNFSRHLPQIAIVSFDSVQFTDRLIGSTIIEMLEFAMGAQYNEEKRLGYCCPSLREILDTTKEKAQPLYFIGELAEKVQNPVEFGILSLPFSLKADQDEFDTIILAFEFQKKSILQSMQRA